MNVRRANCSEPEMTALEIVEARVAAEHSIVFKIDTDFFHDGFNVFSNDYKELGSVMRFKLNMKFGSKLLFMASPSAWSSDIAVMVSNIGTKFLGESLQLIWLPGGNNDLRIIICTLTQSKEVDDYLTFLLNTDRDFFELIVGAMSSTQIKKLKNEEPGFAELLERFPMSYKTKSND